MGSAATQAGMVLGPAQDYSVFILGDASQVYTDAEGRWRSEETRRIQDTAWRRSCRPTPRMRHGGWWESGVQQWDDPWRPPRAGRTPGMAGVNVTGTKYSDKPIDFAAAAASLRKPCRRSWPRRRQAERSAWEALGRGGGSADGGRLQALNVFNLTAAQFASANNNGLDIVAPTGSAVLINVDRTAPTAGEAFRCTSMDRPRSRTR